MEGVIKRLISWCNENPTLMDDAFKIVDYTLRKYGEEHHNYGYWFDFAKSGEDATISSSRVLWTSFAYIMGGEDD